MKRSFFIFLMLILLISCTVRPLETSETRDSKSSETSSAKVESGENKIFDEIEMSLTLSEELSPNKFKVTPHANTSTEIDHVVIPEELIKHPLKVGDALRIRGYLHNSVITVEAFDYYYPPEPETGGSDGIQGIEIEANVGQQVDEYDYALYDVKDHPEITTLRMTQLQGLKGWLPGDRMKIYGVVTDQVIEAFKMDHVVPLDFIGKLKEDDYVSFRARVEEVTKEWLFVRDTNPIFLLPRAKIIMKTDLLPENLEKDEVVRIIGRYQKQEEERIIVDPEKIVRD